MQDSPLRCFIVATIVFGGSFAALGGRSMDMAEYMQNLLFVPVWKPLCIKCDIIAGLINLGGEKL